MMRGTEAILLCGDRKFRLGDVESIARSSQIRPRPGLGSQGPSSAKTINKGLLLRPTVTKDLTLIEFATVNKHVVIVFNLNGAEHRISNPVYAAAQQGFLVDSLESDE